MSSGMIEPVPAPCVDTVVEDPVTAVKRRRTDYAGTVWYGGRAQPVSGMRVSRGGLAQITTPFWLPDSHLYVAGAVGDAVVQVTAAVQSTIEHAEIVEVGAGLADDPKGGGGLRVYVAVSAAGRVPLGVAYRVTVLCSPEAVAQD